MIPTTRRSSMPAIVLVLALLAGACGTNGGSGAPAATSGSSAAAGSSSAGGSPAAGGSSAAANLTGTLTVWAMGNEGTKLSILADAFTKANPGVKVNVTPVDWGQAVTKLQTAIAGGTTPDVSQMGTDMMGQFGANGTFDTVPADVDPSTFFQSAWNTNMVGGAVVGVPWYVETRLLYYRTDIATKAGITAPPATWDDLKAMAKAMKDTGGAKWGISLGTKNWQEYFPFLWSNGGDVVDASGNPALNSPQAVEALTFYDSFFTEGLTPKSVPEGFDITPAFVKGDNPMFFSGPWHLGLIKDAGGASFDGKWAIAPMPKKVTGTSFVGGSNMVVFKATKNRDAAWAFVKFVSDPKTQALWYKTVTDLPAVQSAWQEPDVAADPNVKKFGDQLKDTKAQPVSATWSELSAAINDILEKMTTGGLDPKAAADQMQQQATSIGVK
ncbi:MAG: multiple sugar transport system substrate-binding protein [Chloroflexota bacterium]|jgi:multiple sugar transport system substrate-binding protein|nr:multiple sugar transport system substrate-binding protein [Chloroflexota bacterium]